ncbi:MAG: hypothetical protein ACOCVL_00575 [Candidatus Sumerlaeota bacterium]
MSAMNVYCLDSEFVPRKPILSEKAADWWHVCVMPDLGELNGPDPKRQHVVDHGFIQDENGNWQLWACMRGTAVSRLIYGWEGESIEKGPWEEKGVKVRADKEWGEQKRHGNETAGAPFFVKKDGKYYCLYHSNGFRIMESEDGIHYERVKLENGTNRTDIPGGRDVMVLKVDDTWYSYATVTAPIDPDKPHTRENLTSWVVASTSSDFLHWSDGKIVSKGGKPGSGPVDSESPFVVYMDGYYYLFRSSSMTFKTYVYRSKDPMDFGIDDDSKMVAEYAIKAPELVEYEGQWYISDLHDFQGIRMTKLQWIEDDSAE